MQKRYKPGSVPAQGPVSVIYLDAAVACRFEQPTPRQKTGNLYMPVYLALQHMGCAASYVTIRSGGLLPHLFTLTSKTEAVVFCHIHRDVAAALPLTSMSPFVARTFLSTNMERQTSLLLIAKCSIFFQFVFCKRNR